MARPKNPVPTYLHHTKSGQARTKVNGRYVYLGRYGSPESRAEYARICAELATGSPATSAARAERGSEITINELVLAFWKFALRHYRRPDGTATNELAEYRHTFRPLRELYGHTLAAEFGPLGLKAVRDRMVGLGWCRTLVNNRVRRLRHAFKWAAGEQLITFGVYQALTAVVRKRYGLEAAQVVLGHERADVTQLYAEKDLSLAVKVAGEIG